MLVLARTKIKIASGWRGGEGPRTRPEPPLCREYGLSLKRVLCPGSNSVKPRRARPVPRAEQRPRRSRPGGAVTIAAGTRTVGLPPRRSVSRPLRGRGVGLVDLRVLLAFR